MVDEERVIRLAGEVIADVERLRNLSHMEGLAGQADQLDAVKYRFITAIEGCVSIAHHVLASQGWAAAETNASAVRQLHHHSVIGSDLATTMGKAVGFRNLLVHQYGVIDDDAVVSFLGQLDDIERFVHEVLEWTKRVPNE